MNKPLASICIITYNQEAFIAQCIEGALNQECSFDFEIVINDDCSKDGTSAICQSYAAKHPDKIRYIRNEKNLGMVGNWVAGIQRCSGSYIALCEGDDYFTSRQKLQKQVDFLMQHPDYSICFHRASLVYDEGIEPFYKDINKDTVATTTLLDMVKGNYIHTPTCLFRKNFDVFPSWYADVPTADWALHILNAEYGKIYFIDEEMAAYRIHYGGVLSTKKDGGPLDIKKMEMYFHLAEYFKTKDASIYKLFYELHHHQKAVLYGIRNMGKKSVFRRLHILIHSAVRVKKAKLLIAAVLLPFFPGDSLNKLWSAASRRKRVATQ